MKFQPVHFLTLVFILFVFWIIYTADTGGTIVFTQWVRFLPYPDKWGHAILYGMLAFLLNISLQFKRVNLAQFNPYLGAVIVIVFAILEELTQGLLDTRSLDFGDVMADLVGVILFSWIVKRLEKRNKNQH